MGGLVNRIRRFVGDDGRPLVLGFHAVGDAHTCTNPIYGRGCSLALVQAVALADALTAHPARTRSARAQAYEEACRELHRTLVSHLGRDRPGPPGPLPAATASPARPTRRASWIS